MKKIGAFLCLVSVGISALFYSGGGLAAPSATSQSPNSSSQDVDTIDAKRDSNTGGFLQPQSGIRWLIVGRDGKLIDDASKLETDNENVNVYDAAPSEPSKTITFQMLQSDGTYADKTMTMEKYYEQAKVMEDMWNSLGGDSVSTTRKIKVNGTVYEMDVITIRAEDQSEDDTGPDMEIEDSIQKNISMSRSTGDQRSSTQSGASSERVASPDGGPASSTGTSTWTSSSTSSSSSSSSSSDDSSDTPVKEWSFKKGKKSIAKIRAKLDLTANGNASGNVISGSLGGSFDLNLYLFGHKKDLANASISLASSCNTSNESGTASLTTAFDVLSYEPSPISYSDRFECDAVSPSGGYSLGDGDPLFENNDFDPKGCMRYPLFAGVKLKACIGASGKITVGTSAHGKKILYATFKPELQVDAKASASVEISIAGFEVAEAGAEGTLTVLHLAPAVNAYLAPTTESGSFSGEAELDAMSGKLVAYLEYYSVLAGKYKRIEVEILDWDGVHRDETLFDVEF